MVTTDAPQLGTQTLGSGSANVLEELLSLGLDVELNEARAKRIKGQLFVIEGRWQQGEFTRPGMLGFDERRFYCECYHAVAREIVDANTSDETLEEVIPGFLLEYGKSRKWRSSDKLWIKRYCHGALLEWQGRHLSMAAERTPSTEMPPIQAEVGDDEVNEVELRKKLLDDYTRKTGASHRSIYESNLGCYKPEFYKWRRGTLPRDSATTRNLERFLREGKPPVPRKRKN